MFTSFPAFLQEGIILHLTAVFAAPRCYSRTLFSFTGEAEHQHQTGLAVTAGSVCEAGSPKEAIFPCSLACVSMAGARNLISKVPSKPSQSVIL